MEMTGASGVSGNSSQGGALDGLSIQHFLRVLLHRKWLIILIFLVVASAGVIVCSRLPNSYTSETLILVDPQQVPEHYVTPTVTGDIGNRLSTLSQQVLSATR